VEDYIAPLALLVILFIGFGLVHRNGKGAGCSGCTSCEDESECRNKNADVDAARPS
jgi:hypothetical protein